MKIIKILAGLHFGVSSIAVGSALEVYGCDAFLLGVDHTNHTELRLVKEGIFHFDPLLGRLGNNEVDLLAWKPGDDLQDKEFNLEQITRQIFIPTTEIEWGGNLSSGAATPVGEAFVHTQCVYDGLGTPHTLTFKFTRLPAGLDADNKVQYSLEINSASCSIKRADSSGVEIDANGTPMIVTFNQNGQLNLFDYGQTTVSDTPPKIYLDPFDTRYSKASQVIQLKWGQGAGGTKGFSRYLAKDHVKSRLSSYDGFSKIQWTRQDGGHAYAMVLSGEYPLRLSWIEGAAGVSANALSVPSAVVCPTTVVQLSGNLSSGSSMPVSGTFTKIQRIFDSMGTPHNMIFKFTRLPSGQDPNNHVQYSIELTVDGGSVKRTDASGAVIDSTGIPMIVTFNSSGALNLCDFECATESNVPPQLYVEWTDPSINSAPVKIDLMWGRGKGASPTIWTGKPEPIAEANLTAYDGNSVITYSQQDGLGMGKYEGLRVSDHGEVSVNYSNGHTQNVGRLVFARIPKSQGLEVVGASYRITAASGMPTLSPSGTLTLRVVE